MKLTTARALLERQLLVTSQAQEVVNHLGALVRGVLLRPPGHPEPLARDVLQYRKAC